MLQNSSRLDTRWIGPLLLALLTCALVIYLTHYVYLRTLRGGLHGYEDLPQLVTDVLRPALMVAGTFLGILFSLLVKQLTKDSPDSSIVLSKRRMLLAALLSPLVIAAVYSQLVNLTSPWLVFLIAYQNGYFWESMLNTMKSAHHGSGS
jgi:hypothetical protein